MTDEASESLLCFKRAGADGILTYFALKLRSCSYQNHNAKLAKNTEFTHSLTMEQRKPIFDNMPLRLRMTRASSCAYIEGNIEQRLAVDLADHPHAHDQLAAAGFRRVENWVYKPVCQTCQACMPIRIDCLNFRAGRNLSRIFKSNQDLTRTISTKQVNQDHYILFQEYLTHRHEDGQMSAMNFKNFQI